MGPANKITSPAKLRAVLLATMEAVIEGKVNINQANAVTGLSQEVHKSIRQEFDMRCYAEDTMSIKEGEIVTNLIGD